MFEVLYAVVGVVAGFIAHWVYVVWSRRDIIGWSVDYWVKAWEDGRITVDEVFMFIEVLVEKLGLKGRVVVERRG